MGLWASIYFDWVLSAAPEGPIQYNESTAEYGEEKRREEDLGHYFKDKLDGRFYKEYKYAVAGNKVKLICSLYEHLESCIV